MIAVDTETTGMDFWHGARPYFVTTCDEHGKQRFWEWDVDPLTRVPHEPADDLVELVNHLTKAGQELVGQNVKFDVHSLTMAYADHCCRFVFPWELTRDTLIAGHLLASNQPHDLTSMVMQYLGEDIEPFEKALEKATQEARRWARRHRPEWAIAKKGRPDMPSAKDKTWKIDAWLPRTLRRLERVGDDTWDTVLSDYANADSAATIALWGAMEPEIKRRGQWEIFLEQMRLAEVLWRMEGRGVTYNLHTAAEIRERYTVECERVRETMRQIANNKWVQCTCMGLPVGCRICFGKGAHPFELEMPKAGMNGSLKRFMFEVLEIPVVQETETGQPSTAAECFPMWYARLPDECEARTFLECLEVVNAHGKALEALERYERYAIPDGDALDADGSWATLHPSVNQTATDTLRTSSSNPNSQNVSTEADELGTSLRSPFGPAPGREWWAIDYANIELRIPAYVSGEQELIALFERPDDPPYYGSEHLLNFHTVYPDWWEEALAEVGGDLTKVGNHIKESKKWKPRYKRCKNGDFAVGYGAGSRTADSTFGRAGSRDRIIRRFQRKERLTQQKIAEAGKRGFVTTLPDREICPTEGYPVWTSRSEHGTISPTLPLNYWCQSTACWIARRALVACEGQLKEWRAVGFDAWMVLYVHDEIVFDFPLGGKRNLPRVRKLVRIMESMGDAVGVPLKAEWKYCPTSWADSEKPI